MRVDQLETSATRTSRSVGELEGLGEELSETVGCQGIELARLEDMSCHCVPSTSDSYRTPEVAEEGSLQLGQCRPFSPSVLLGRLLGVVRYPCHPTAFRNPLPRT